MFPAIMKMGATQISGVRRCPKVFWAPSAPCRVGLAAYRIFADDKKRSIHENTYHTYVHVCMYVVYIYIYTLLTGSSLLTVLLPVY